MCLYLIANFGPFLSSDSEPGSPTPRPDHSADSSLPVRHKTVRYSNNNNNDKNDNNKSMSKHVSFLVNKAILEV